jgi:hypothetical protein
VRAALRRRGEVRDELVAWARETAADLRAYGLPHPVFGVFDGVQWMLFAAAHTDNHLPQLHALRAHRELSARTGEPECANEALCRDPPERVIPSPLRKRRTSWPFTAESSRRAR